MWWPQLWNYGPRGRGYNLTPGGVYEFSIVASGTIPQINLRATAYVKKRRGKMSHGVTVSKKRERKFFRFVVPPGADRVLVGLSSPRVSGEAIYEDARLRRVLSAEDATKLAKAAFRPPDYAPDPDPIHGLDALCERAGHKPWARYQKEGGLRTYRVMFRDRKYGTGLWMLDNSPSHQYVVTASIWPGWNADGSQLMISGSRMSAKGRKSKWVCDPDFALMKPMPVPIQPIWDLKDPDVYYYHRRGKVRVANLRTGKDRILAEWKPRARERVYGLTKDTGDIFVTDHDGGLWVPYRPGKDSLPHVRVLDCYGQAPGGKDMMRSLAISAVTPKGRIFRILVGTRVKTATGRMTRVIVPISGRTEYLKTFASGRVTFPTDARLPATRDLKELFSIYNQYPSCSHGHISYSPDGQYVCWDGQARSYRVRDHGDAQSSRLSANGGVYHTCWFYDPRFYVTCVRAYRSGYDRAHNGGVMGQVFTDGTWQPVCDIKQRRAAFYYQGNFATFSRDATKVHYESSMTGIPKNYIAVMARPQPPRDVSWRAEGRSVVLRWKAAPHHVETQGYLVYRSDQSGDGYELLTREPVKATSWRDTSLKPGRAYYYVVTALEHCGLESGYSAEAARAGVGVAPSAAPLVVYVETEDALVDLYTSDKPGVSRGRDGLGASNWYYVYRSPKAKRGVATLTIQVPAAAEYHTWLRVRNSGKTPAAWALAADGKGLGRASCPGKDWSWVRTGPAQRIAAGKRRVTLTTGDAGAQADLLCMTTSAAFRPKGVRPEDRRPPAPVTGLTVAKAEGRTVELKWRPSREADFWHYNVYASRKPMTAPAQANLLASPTYPEFIDWGLGAGTAYHYAVTAVDRRGNESALGAVAKATTPPRAFPVQKMELPFAQAELKGPFTRAKAKGTHGKQYVILPSKPDAKRATASWRVRVERPAKFYFWLRYLPRGAGSVRAAAVKQAVRVTLDGKAVATLAPGKTDLSCGESAIRPEFWTWARPVSADLYGVDIAPGQHTLTAGSLTAGVRYDSIYITDEPSFQPPDGRLRQNQ